MVIDSVEGIFRSRIVFREVGMVGLVDRDRDRGKGDFRMGINNNSSSRGRKVTKIRRILLGV